MSLSFANISKFPIPTVTKWLGNTSAIAMRHYVGPTDPMYEVGAQSLSGGAQSGVRNGIQSSARGLKSDSEEGSEGGARSGAVTVQNRAQQGEAASRKNKQDETQVMASYAVISHPAPSWALVKILQTERTGFEPARGGTPLRI